MDMSNIGLFIAGGCVAALLLIAGRQDDGNPANSENTFDDSDAPDMSPTIADEIQAAAASVRNAVMPTDAAGMVPSAELLAMLKAGEALRLTPYRLGDGGSTIGYGRYYSDNGPQAPASITADQAESWFADDVENKGARWVRTYVTAPVLQHEFDALVSMAFNMSPRSFKTIAQAVNEGADPEGAALRFVLAGSKLERGLRNRRAREIALYRQGVYA